MSIASKSIHVQLRYDSGVTIDLDYEPLPNSVGTPEVFLYKEKYFVKNRVKPGVWIEKECLLLEEES